MTRRNTAHWFAKIGQNAVYQTVTPLPDTPDCDKYGPGQLFGISAAPFDSSNPYMEAMFG